MATEKKNKTKSNPSPAQLRARRKFAAAAKARGKAARAAKRALGLKAKPKKAVTRKPAAKRTVAKKRNYTTAGPVRVGGVTYPKGTTFPPVRYVGAQGLRPVVFQTKAEALTWAKLHAEKIRASVKIKKEVLNKNGVTYRGAGSFSIKPAPIKTNPAKRKRNAESYSSAHPIEVRKYYRSGGAGYKTQWQRAHEAGQHQLFPVKNGVKVTKIAGQTLNKAVKDEIKKQFPTQTGLIKRHVPSVGYVFFIKQGSKTLGKVFHEFGKMVIYNNISEKKKNGSSAAKEAYKEFTGKPSKKTISMYAPKGSGARGSLAAMGKLKKIFVRGRKPLDFKGGANAPVLARDPKTNQMFVLGKNYRLAMPRKNSNSMEDLGEITRIEYEAQKVHLGDKDTVTYYHKMGEEGGERPHCLVNSEGLIVISGGDYTIGAEGIRN